MLSESNWNNGKNLNLPYPGTYNTGNHKKRNEFKKKINK